MDRIFVCLKSQPPEAGELWQSRYVLLLWLSLVLMAPFDLRNLHGDPSTQAIRIQIVDSVLPLAEFYMGASSRERDAAALLIARLLTRKDVNSLYIPEFLERSVKIWQSDNTSLNFKTGFLTAMCEIYKLGERSILAEHADAAIKVIRDIGQLQDTRDNTLLRKLQVKLSQRLSLCVLYPHTASWRYQASKISVK